MNAPFTPPATLAKVPPCHFMKLPPELRLEIYGYVWSEKKRIKILFDFNGKVVRDGSLGPTNVTRLQSTCRLIHHEAVPVLYGSITFDLRSVDRIIEPLDCDKLLALKTPWLKYIHHLHLGFQGLSAHRNSGLLRLLTSLLSSKWQDKSPQLAELGFYSDFHDGVSMSSLDLAMVMRSLVNVRFRGCPVVVVRKGPARVAAVKVIHRYLQCLGEGGGFDSASTRG
ncbi:hypothetical protein LTR49_008241 [Elasticomyces elasticus]|nr:hypothetical protein LTR49_008241 [Elasticomyces elasticus]